MRAVLLAPFLLSVRPDLAELLQRDSASVRAALADQGLPGWDVLIDSTPETAALIHEHEPIGATLVPRRLLSARAQSGAHPSLQAKHVTEVELSVGVHGTGCVVLWYDGPLAGIAEVERAACTVVGEVASAVTGLLSRQPGGMVERAAEGRYPMNDFLWWHRVLRPSTARDRTAARALLTGAVERTVGPGVELAVGDGWSVLDGGSDEELASVVRGLVDAEEIWTTSETASRDVVLQMALVQGGADSPHLLVERRAAAVKVAETIQLRAAVLQDQVRYTAGLRRTTLDTAAQAWELSLVLAPVIGHLEALQVMLSRRIEERREVHSARTQAALFALAVLTAFGLVLALFETAFGLPLEEHTSRLVIAGAVLLVAFGSAGIAWIIDRRRTT